jgi:cyclic lactone autoinducer peptide
MIPALRRYCLPALALALAAAMAGGCGQLDNPPNTNYNGFDNRKPPTVVKPNVAVGDAGACVPPDAGACDVKLSVGVATIFNNSCTTSSCHGTTYEPKMPKDNLKELWENLKAYRNKTTNLPYVSSCTTDPAASYIIDNLKADAQKGGQRMPQGQALSADDIMIVEKWVKCGAPFN